jgi:hypothetical protein
MGVSAAAPRSPSATRRLVSAALLLAGSVVLAP